MLQLLINIVFSGLIYLLIALSFAFIYSTIKFFNISHAAIISLGAYFCFLFYQLMALPILLSIILSLFFCVLTGIGLEKIVFRNLRKVKSSSMTMLISSIGIYVIFQNIISLLWGDDTKSIRFGVAKIGHNILGAYITDIQIIIILVCLLLFAATIIFQRTKLGGQMKAVSENETLTKVFGIESDRIILYSYIIGSALAALTGILVAFDTGITPNMGFNLLLYGIVAMIIGGVGSTWGLLFGSLLLATAQHLGAYYIDSKWMDAIAYLVLILFLIWKPLGFSGKRLKKVEI